LQKSGTFSITDNHGLCDTILAYDEQETGEMDGQTDGRTDW